MDQHTPEYPVICNAHNGKKRLLVMVQDYQWKFVSPQLLDHKGREIMYPVEDDRDQWWARRSEDTVNHHRDLAERDLDGLQAYSLDVCEEGAAKWKRRNVVSVLREMSITIYAPEAVVPRIYAILRDN